VPVWRRSRRRTAEVRIAVAGLNGRGAEHVEAFRAIDGVRIVAPVDVDEQVLAQETAKFRSRGEKVAEYSDLRHVLDRPDVDALAIATPNHWHALQAIWACQAGKDVYLEAPVSHVLVEGIRLVEAARRYGRIVQTGLQSRSSAGIAEAIAWVRSGALGPIQLARALCYLPRPTIGSVGRAQRIPDHVDYDLWCGPAPLATLRRARLHHDWRWFFDTGNGEIGQRGVHQLDLCRWATGQNRLPAGVQSLGARLGYDDDGETPNTQLVLYDYDPPVLFELRGLPRDAEVQDWDHGMDRFLDVSAGVILHCEGGRLEITSHEQALARDAEGTEIGRWSGAPDPFASFVAAVRSRRIEELTAEVAEGHLSSALCHLANVSQRLGSAAERDALRSSLGETSSLGEPLERLLAHLDANAIDPAKEPLVLGPRLEVDPAAERFVADEHERANRLLTREYREPYVLPEAV
jgi:predicted dehydrogenase